MSKSLTEEDRRFYCKAHGIVRIADIAHTTFRHHTGAVIEENVCCACMNETIKAKGFFVTEIK